MSAPKGRQAQPPNFYDDARARLQAEREATREVTRELHEAIQEGRQLVRQLRQEMKEATEWLGLKTGELDEFFREHVNARVAETNEQLDGDMAAIQQTLHDMHGKIAAYQAQNLGFKSQEELMERLAADIARAVGDPRYIQAIADQVMRSHGCDCPPGAHPMFPQGTHPVPALPSQGIQVGPVRVRVARPGEAPGLYEGDRP